MSKVLGESPEALKTQINLQKTPIQRIRAYCRWCMNGQSFEVTHCQSIDCAFYQYRAVSTGEKPFVSSAKAIKARCLQCSETYEDLKNCEFKDCPLWSYRFGRNPYKTKRTLNEEQKAKCIERLEKYRKLRKEHA